VDVSLEKGDAVVTYDGTKAQLGPFREAIDQGHERKTSHLITQKTHSVGSPPFLR
jgi:hypothetical protein